MDKIRANKMLSYAAGNDEHRDLFITVELTDRLYGKDEEKIIDMLMEKFYEEYDDGMRKLWKERYGKDGK